MRLAFPMRSLCWRIRYWFSTTACADCRSSPMRSSTNLIRPKPLMTMREHESMPQSPRSTVRCMCRRSTGFPPSAKLMPRATPRRRNSKRWCARARNSSLPATSFNLCQVSASKPTSLSRLSTSTAHCDWSIPRPTCSSSRWGISRSLAVRRKSMCARSPGASTSARSPARAGGARRQKRMMRWLPICWAIPKSAPNT